MYMITNHPRVYVDAGKWYFWHEDSVSHEGPFETDWQASHAAYAYDLARETDKGRKMLESTFGAELVPGALNSIAEMCRALNDQWWRDPDTLSPLPSRNRGELIALMHSELSEALEGMRKNRDDEHLPHRKSEEVELADALIRIFDYAGGHGLDLGGALVEKCRYNLARADHKPENRKTGGDGKRF